MKDPIHAPFRIDIIINQRRKIGYAVYFGTQAKFGATKKKKKPTTTSDILPTCGDVPMWPLFKLRHVCDVADVITDIKFCVNCFMGFRVVTPLSLIHI